MKIKIAAVILTSLFLGSISVVSFPNGEFGEKAKNCLTIIVGKDASSDGSVLLGHNEDIAANTCMHIYAAAKTQYDTGDIIKTYYGVEVPQVEETYTYFCVKVFNKTWVPGDFSGGINEFQVAIANNLAYSKETRMRPQSNPNAGQILWSEFMQIALERSKTAIEAVKIISWLVEEHGLALDPGTMFGVSDPNEG